MKTFILLLAMIGCLTTVESQTKLLKGGWKTSPDQKLTTISSADVNERIYRISSISLDTHDTNFKVIVDGVEQQEPFPEGSAVFIQGKSIAIKQIGNGEIHMGQWEVTNSNANSRSTLAWRSNDPTSNTNKVLVANFSSNKNFVLSFNFQTTSCTNGTGKMIVWVDGVKVKDADGNDQVFLQGSSYYGIGRRVEVNVTGTCSTGHAFGGEFSYR